MSARRETVFTCAMVEDKLFKNGYQGHREGPRRVAKTGSRCGINADQRIVNGIRLLCLVVLGIASNCVAIGLIKVAING